MRPRRLGPVTVTGVVTADAGAYLDTLGVLPAGCVVADLRSGTWRVAQAARELGEQLGVRLVDDLPDSPLDDRTQTQRRLDDETTGDSTARRMITAAARARAAADRLGVRVFVALPASGPLDAADAVFVAALAEACSDAMHPLVVLRSSSDADCLPGDLRVTWSEDADRSDGGSGAGHGSAQAVDGMPGIVPSTVAAACGRGGRELRGGTRLGTAPGGELLHESRRLLRAALGDELPELSAFLQAALGEQVDPWLLLEQAGAQIADGGDELPRRLAAAAREAMPTPSKRGLCDLLIASAHVAHARFADVTAMPLPEEGLHPPLRAMLVHVHGWARTMTGRAPEALPFFEQSRALLAREPDSDEYLSTLNITALARLRCDDWGGAWELESGIERRLTTLSRTNAQLVYINAMNMARLQRRAGDTALQFQQTVRAFATTRGLRSDSDGIHENIALGRLLGDLGDPVAARAAYLRAAVLLLSCEYPETVTPRITAALPRRAVAPDGPETLVDRLAATLSEQLDAAAGRVPEDRAAPAAAGRPASFRRDIPSVVAAGTARAAGVRGCAVLVLPADVASPTDSAALRRLAAVVSAALGVRSGSLVVVDDRLGTEIPAGPDGLLPVARRLGIELADADRVLGWPAAQVAAGPGLAAVEPAEDGTAVARFRRYRVPLVLAAPDARLVRTVLDSGRPCSEAELASALDRDEAELTIDVTRLEQARVLLRH